MNDERAVEEIVTKFLLNTCRLCPKLSRPAVEAAMFCAGISTNTRLDINLLPVTEGNAVTHRLSNHCLSCNRSARFTSQLFHTRATITK